MAEQSQPIPFIDLAAQRARIAERIDAAIARVLEHGQFILGPEVAELEDELQSFTGAKHCITCANGTDALTMVLMAEGIGPGDGVIVPSFTFVATAETVAQLGATPVFADVNPSTFNLDPDGLEEALKTCGTAGVRPRAVIAVDLFGRPADYAALAPIATAHEILLVADAAQSLGGALGAQKVGTLADYTSTSFFPAKPLGCYGDGGAIFVAEKEKADILRSLRMHGQGSDKYDNIRIGLNSRLDTLQAAILLEKLKIFPDEIASRSRIARKYTENMRDIIAVPECSNTDSSVWAQYTVQLKSDAARKVVQCACANANIPTAIYYPLPLHMQAGYAHYPAPDQGLPASEQLAQTVMSLPMHAYLTDEEQDRIISTVSDAVSKGS